MCIYTYICVICNTYSVCVCMYIYIDIDIWVYRYTYTDQRDQFFEGLERGGRVSDSGGFVLFCRIS